MRNRTPDQYLDELAAVSLFHGLWRRDLEAVARVVDVVEVDAGAVVVRQGESGHELFVVARGSATAATDGRPAAMLGPGDVFGEAGVLAGVSHRATITAATRLRLLVLGRREVFGLLHAVPALARRLLEDLARRTGKADEVRDVGRVSAQEVPDDPGPAPQPRGPLRPRRRPFGRVLP